MEKASINSMESLRRTSLQLDAKRKLHLSILGDQLAEKERYAEDGMDALYLYIFEKYAILPSRSAAMRVDAISNILFREMREWKLPAEYRDVKIPEGTDTRDVMGLRLAQFTAEADMSYHLELFGDYISESEGYSVDGRKAVEIYVCRKFGFLPYEVEDWSHQTLMKISDPEFSQWIARKESM